MPNSDRGDVLTEALQDAGATLLGTPNLAVAVEAAVSGFGTAIGADRGYLYRFGADPLQHDCVYCWCRNGEAVCPPSVMEKQLQEWHAHLAHPLRVELRLFPDAESTVLAALRDGVGVAGFVAFDSTTARDWSDEELSTLHLFTTLLSLSYQNRGTVRDSWRRLSHELLTPLSGVIGLLDATLETKLDSKPRRWVFQARQKAAGLVQLVETVLESDDVPSEPTLIIRGSQPSIVPHSGSRRATSTHPPQAHILVAEDEEINRWIAKRMLETMGHRVVTVSNGEDALRAMDSSRFDLVLMDIQMPVMDGIAATRALREREQSGAGHTPVVAVTAHVTRGERERLLEIGFDEYLAKPLDLERLRGLLENLLRKRSKAVR